MPVTDCFQPETEILSLPPEHVEFGIGGQCPPYVETVAITNMNRKTGGVNKMKDVLSYKGFIGSVHFNAIEKELVHKE